MQTVHLGSVNDALLQDSGIGGALRASTSITSRRPCRRPSHSCPRMTRNDKQRAVTCVSLTASGLLERVGTQAPTQKTQYRLKLEKKVKSNSFNFYPFWREWERERKEKNFFFFSNHPWIKLVRRVTGTVSATSSATLQILFLSVIKEAAMMDKMDGIKKEREKRKWWGSDNAK